MSVDIKKYSDAIRDCCEAYFYNEITREEYLKQRDLVFDEISNLVSDAKFSTKEIAVTDEKKDNLVDKLTSLLKS